MKRTRARLISCCMLAVVTSCTHAVAEDPSQSLTGGPISASDWESTPHSAGTVGLADLPATDFMWVPLEEQPEAIELLRDATWRSLNKEQSQRFGAAQLVDRSSPDLVPFLVRGIRALASQRDGSLAEHDRLQLSCKGTRLRVLQTASRNFDSYQAAPRAILVMLPRSPTEVQTNTMAAFYGGVTSK